MPLEASRQHRGGQHDRRRRLLTDELSHSSQWPAARAWPNDPPPPQKSEHYGDAEFLDRQKGVFDLMPRGWTRLAAMLSLVLAALVGLELAYHWAVDRAAGGTVVAALDIGAKGSLAAWLSSLMLLAATVFALLIHAVRRHRTDDYQGRYRIWRWAAACWFLMASDEAASLREAFRESMVALTGTRLVGDGDIWWAILCAVALGAVGSRLMLDMRPNWSAIAALAAAGCGYALALVCVLGWIALPATASQAMLGSSAQMGGHLLLLVAMTLHARFVIRDAEGLLPKREPAPAGEELEQDESKEEETGSSSAGDAWLKVDPPHATPPLTLGRSAAASSSSNIATAAADSSPLQRKLTKGERRALKERLVRERMDRERRVG